MAEGGRGTSDDAKASTSKMPESGESSGLNKTDGPKPRIPRRKFKKNEQDTEDDEKAEKFFKAKGKTASGISVATLDMYDPYEYREGMGHLSYFQAWAHLVKCSFGTGVLTMPKGFAHCGLIPGLVLGVLIGGFCLYCMHILVKAMVHISARERIPYVPFNQTMKYTFDHGYPLCKPLSKFMKTFTDIIIVGYHFGICIAYVNYMAQTLLTVTGYGECAEGYNVPVVVSTVIWLPLLCIINCVRRLELLTPVSMAGNVLTAFSMGIITYFIFLPDEKTGKLISDTWELFGSWETTPLYIGIILFAVEAFGVIIAVERDMKNPRRFLGWTGVFNTAMILVLSWYILLGLLGYLRFGKEVKSTISLTIPSDTWASKAMYVMLGLSLYCSYPLHCFVCIDIIWNNHILPKLSNKQLTWEIVFRCGAVVVSGIIAAILPQLDLLVSLIGAVCLSFLGIMMPGIMEYNVAWSKYGNVWTSTMTKGMIIAIIGGFAFLIGTYGSLYGILFQAADAASATHNKTCTW